MKKTLLGSLLVATLVVSPVVFAVEGDQAFIGTVKVGASVIDILEDDYTDLDENPVSGTLQPLTFAGVVITEGATTNATKGSTETYKTTSNSTRVNNASILKANDYGKGWLLGIFNGEVVAYKKASKKTDGVIGPVNGLSFTTDGFVYKSYSGVYNEKSEKGSSRTQAYVPVTWTFEDIGGEALADLRSTSSVDYKKEKSKSSITWTAPLRGAFIGSAE